MNHSCNLYSTMLSTLGNPLRQLLPTCVQFTKKVCLNWKRISELATLILLTAVNLTSWVSIIRICLRSIRTPLFLCLLLDPNSNRKNLGRGTKEWNKIIKLSKTQLAEILRASCSIRDLQLQHSLTTG